MTELIFTKTGTNMLSGNPIEFEVAITPYNYTTQKETIFLIITIAQEIQPNSTVFIPIKTQKVYPNDAGITFFDVASIVDPYLHYFTPPVDLDQLIEIPSGQCRRFSVKFALFNSVTLIKEETKVITVIKAGAPYQFFNPDFSYKWQGSATEAKLLYLTDRKDTVALEEIFYLFFTAAQSMPPLITAFYTIDYWLNDERLTANGGIPGQIEMGGGSFSDLVTDVTWTIDVPNQNILFSYIMPTLASVDRIFFFYRLLGETTWYIPLYDRVTGLPDFNVTFPNTYEFKFGSYSGNTLIAMTPIVLVTGDNPIPVFPPNYLRQLTIGCLPAGFFQLGLHNQIPAGAVPINYSLTIEGTAMGNTISYFETLFFEIDHRNFYNAAHLLYRNSLGGLQSLKLLGTIEAQAQYQFQDVNRMAPPSYLQNGNLLAQTEQLFTEENEKYTAETGFVTKYQAERIRDFFLSKQRYELKDGRLIPITLNGKTVKFFTNRDNLISVQIEYQHAYANSFFSHANLPPDHCPAINTLNWRQTATNEITIFYSFPFGHEYGVISVNFPGETPQLFYIGGNSGLRKLPFTRPASAVGVDVMLTVTGKVICKRYSQTPSFGPLFSVPPMELVVEKPPVATNDVYNITAGFISVIDLNGSVLANDYDPAGAPIEVIATTGSTSEGGTYNITAEGLVSYQPISSTFTGDDTFTYEMRKVPAGTPVMATVTIKVGAVSVTVYAKIINRNYNGFITNNGEVWIDFFSDPSGSIPVDVTTFPFTLNYSIINFREEYGSGNTTTTTNHTAVANGFRVKIYDGPLVYSEMGNQGNDWITLTFTLSTGNGYQPI